MPTWVLYPLAFTIFVMGLMHTFRRTGLRRRFSLQSALIAMTVISVLLALLGLAIHGK